MSSENRCVCCGEIIPEGAYVCKKCENAYKKESKFSDNVLLEKALELLSNFDSQIPCDELSGTEYCENNCNYASPTKECWKQYIKELLK